MENIPHFYSVAGLRAITVKQTAAAGFESSGKGNVLSSIIMGSVWLTFMHRNIVLLLEYVCLNHSCKLRGLPGALSYVVLLKCKEKSLLSVFIVSLAELFPAAHCSVKDISLSPLCSYWLSAICKIDRNNATSFFLSRLLWFAICQGDIFKDLWLFFVCFCVLFPTNHSCLN